MRKWKWEVVRSTMVLTGALACAPTRDNAPGDDYDVVIASGRVVDGTGNAWFLGDVAIRGDRVVRITPAGQGLLLDLQPHIRELMDQLATRLNDHDCHELSRICERIYAGDDPGPG